MKVGVAYEKKTCIQRLAFTLTKYRFWYSGHCCYYIEISPLIYRENQWEGFYTSATLDLPFRKKFLSPFLECVLNFYKSITPKIQTENLPNNSQKHF